MTLVRWRPRREWDPFARFFDFQRDLSNMLAPLIRSEGELGEWIPPVDVYSDDEKVVVQAEVPGLREKEIEVAFDDGVLTISGERRHEAKSEEKGYHRLERAYGSFQRALRLPGEVDGSKIKAELKDGILTVTLPKAEQAKARKINVEAK